MIPVDQSGVARLRVDDSAEPSQNSNLGRALSVVIATIAEKEISSGCNAKDFKVLRRACRELRDLHDTAAVREILLGSANRPFGWQPPSPEEVEAATHGVLTRGGKPTSVSLELGSRSTVTATWEQSVLALLGALADGEAPITRVKLGAHTPITEAVARAVARFSPSLTHLEYWYCPDPTPVDGAGDGDEDAAVHSSSKERLVAALQLLLQLTGPGLKDLVLCANDLNWPSHVANPLPYCTALTRLHLQFNMASAGYEDGGLAAESAVLAALPSLANLRDLRLENGAEPPADPAVRQARAVALGSCLSPLTALTRLHISLCSLQHALEYDIEGGNGHTVFAQIAQLQSEGRAEEADQLESAVAAEWRAVAMAARCMPSLVELHTPAVANVADLGSLTALTSLTAGALELPKQLHADDNTTTPPLLGSQQREKAPVYELPPLLERLKVNAPLPLDVAAALRRSSSAATAAPGSSDAAAATSTAAPAAVFLRASHTSWCMGNYPCWGLEFRARGRNYLDAEGRLTAQAITDIRSALANLKDTFGRLLPPPAEGGGSVHLVISAGGSRVLPPSEESYDGAGDGTHWGSWLGPVVEDLPPLQGLKLSGFALSPRDMLSLGRSLQGVKILNLRGCSYPLPAIPLLARLNLLEELCLRADDWVAAPAAGGDDDDDGGALQQQLKPSDVESVFLCLVAPLSSSGAGGGNDGEASRQQSAEGGSSSPVTAVAATAALPLPNLRMLNIDCAREDDVDWLEEALASVRVELEQLRPVSAGLDIRCVDDY
ncbi:hypothetical protein PLESTB_000644500 [Pleodorina starrii]|uniref:Uncharacterized protein n=1 Tax=Pleodorina starrii TaxID=330485 RepID=A0A9W6BI03_9CHLO|nr:hypothetical protein PLESTM_001305800 [Pleodorina starrii]GLC52571.1 hypothetical protein PLESTB_000644500 [Pleodorina starrii]GLC71571.1 hypothetical protein PLESTF_001136700 [Pleodorina starrii]